MARRTKRSPAAVWTIAGRGVTSALPMQRRATFFVAGIVCVVACGDEDKSGTVEPGDKCSSSSECASSSPDDVVNCVPVTTSSGVVYSSAGSVCHVTVRGVEGDACVAEPPPGVGGPREWQPRSIECRDSDSLYCDPGSDTCKRVLELGAECHPYWGACGKSAYCDTTTEKCTKAD